MEGQILLIFIKLIAVVLQLPSTSSLLQCTCCNIAAMHTKLQNYMYVYIAALGLPNNPVLEHHICTVTLLH